MMETGGRDETAMTSPAGWNINDTFPAPNHFCDFDPFKHPFQTLQRETYPSERVITRVVRCRV